MDDEVLSVTSSRLLFTVIAMANGKGGEFLFFFSISFVLNRYIFTTCVRFCSIKQNKNFYP